MKWWIYHLTSRHEYFKSSVLPPNDKEQGKGGKNYTPQSTSPKTAEGETPKEKEEKEGIQKRTTTFRSVHGPATTDLPWNGLRWWRKTLPRVRITLRLHFCQLRFVGHCCGCQHRQQCQQVDFLTYWRKKKLPKRAARGQSSMLSTDECPTVTFLPS